MIFIDMLGAENLKLCNDKVEENDMDRLLKQLGGTLYANCYTPAPDTPRSSACMWSGLYPKENGCNNRLKYPGMFLNRNIKNLWGVVKELNYHTNIFLRNIDERIGLLSENFDDIYNGTLQGFFKITEIRDNSFTFFYLPDLHIYLDGYLYTQKGLNKGLEFVSEMLEKIFSAFPADTFDYVMMYSDHGFRLAGDRREHLLDKDRLKTFMYLRSKGQHELKLDLKLRSNLDVFPTICDILGYRANPLLDGKSLFGEGHEYILCEDHGSFGVNFLNAVEHWGVIYKNRIYCLEYDGTWSHEYEGNEIIPYEKFEKLIMEKMDEYTEHKKLYIAQQIYDDNLVLNFVYSDGSPIKFPWKWVHKLNNLIRNLLKKIGNTFSYLIKK